MPFIYIYNNLKNNNYVYKNYRIGNIVILYSYRRYHPLLCIQRQRSRNSTILSLCCTRFNCIGTYCRITFLTHKKSKKQATFFESSLFLFINFVKRFISLFRVYSRTILEFFSSEYRTIFKKSKKTKIPSIDPHIETGFRKFDISILIKFNNFLNSF